MRRAFCATAGLLALLASTSSRAQDAPIAEVASDLFYDSCMDYLGGGLSLSANPTLRAKGFSDKPEAKQHPKLGLIEIVTAKRSNGSEIAFGGRPGLMCILMVDGPDRIAARDAVKSGLADLAIEMMPFPVPQPGQGIVLEGFKGKVNPNLFFTITLLTAPDTHSKSPVAMTAAFSAE